MRRSILIGGAAVLVVGFLLLRQGPSGGGGSAGSDGVEQALAHLPAGYSASHGAISTSGGQTSIANFVLKRGDSTVFTAESLSLTGIGAATASGLPSNIGHMTAHNAAVLLYRHIDTLELDQLAVARLQALFDPANYPNGKPADTDMQPLLGSADMRGTILHVDVPPVNGKPGRAVDVAVGHMHVAGIRARLFDALPKPEDVSGLALSALLGTGLAEDDMVVEDISATIADVGSFKIASEKLHNYAAGKLESGSVHGLSFTSTKAPGTATLDGMDVSGVDYSGLLAQVVANPGKPIMAMPSAMKMANLALHGLRVDFAQAPLITLDTISAANSYAADGTSTGTGSVDNLAIITTGRPIAEATRAGLKSFGMEDFRIDMAGHNGFDPRSGRVTADHGTIKFQGLGTLLLSYDLDGIPLTQQDPKNIVVAFQNASLISAALGWEDASLVGRLFKVAAERSGKSEAELRATLSMSLLALAAVLPDQPDAADQINAFLDGRHKLTIALNPPAPVHMRDLAGVPATQRAHVLGVRVSGN